MIYYILGIITGIFLSLFLVVIEFYFIMKKKDFIVEHIEPVITGVIETKPKGKIFPGEDDPDVKLNNYLDKKAKNKEDVNLDEIL